MKDRDIVDGNSWSVLWKSEAVCAMNTDEAVDFGFGQFQLSRLNDGNESDPIRILAMDWDDKVRIWIIWLCGNLLCAFFVVLPALEGAVFCISIQSPLVSESFIKLPSGLPYFFCKRNNRTKK